MLRLSLFLLAALATAVAAVGEPQATAAPAAPAAEAPETAPERPIDAEAVALLEQTSRRLAEAQTLHAVVDVAYDVVQDDGLSLEFGGRAEIKLRRPHDFAGTFLSRAGERKGLVFDGQLITAYDATESVYAQVELEGTIDEAFDYLESLGYPVILSDFFRADLPAQVSAGVAEADLVSDLGAEAVAERSCRHLVVRRPGVVNQLWIEGGDAPLPLRLVVSYLDQAGQPQFRGWFQEWSFDPQLSDSDFTYAPPAEYARIVFDAPAAGAQPTEDQP